jgi:hypothetical protein
MTLRAAATWLFGVFVTVLLLPLITANVRKLASERGWDNGLVRLWDALPEKFRDKLRSERLQTLWGLWFIFGASGGVALTLWLSPLLNPPVKWMGILTAIDTFVPTDLRRDFDGLKKQWKDLLQQIDSTNKAIVVNGNNDLRDHLKDLQDKVNYLDADWQRERVTVIEYLHEQLKSGTLLARAYDQDKREEVDIPTAEWEYLQLRVEGSQLKEIGTAGGGGRHLTGVLLGKAGQ